MCAAYDCMETARPGDDLCPMHLQNVWSPPTVPDPPMIPSPLSPSYYAREPPVLQLGAPAPPPPSTRVRKRKQKQRREERERVARERLLRDQLTDLTWCKGRTRLGARCTKFPSVGEYCYLHQPPAYVVPSSASAFQAYVPPQRAVPAYVVPSFQASTSAFQAYVPHVSLVEDDDEEEDWDAKMPTVSRISLVEEDDDWDVTNPLQFDEMPAISPLSRR